MKITSRNEAREGRPMDPAHFTGPASSHPLHSASRPDSLNVSVVQFAAGTRNHWHRHAGGQVLHVVEGEGWVQSRGEPPLRIRSGDTVVADPGEEHWHGADPAALMTHLAINIGETTFLDPSEPPDLSSSERPGRV